MLPVQLPDIIIPMTREQIRVAAFELEPADREILAQELLLSIGDADQDAIDQAWLAEVRRRDAAFTKGTTTASPVDEVITRIKRRANS